MTSIAPALAAPARAHESHRKVSWLELFFDLVFVAAVAQVAEPLRHHYSIDGAVRFTPLFVLIWWAWTGHTIFSTRFSTDDPLQRALTLAQMFAVAAMAANAREALDSRSSAGFAAAYAAMRFVLVAQYLRARHVAGARPLAMRYVTGHGIAAIVWLASSVLPVPARFVAWAVAFVIDFGTPWLAVRHSVAMPPDASHLPERFGLFTLILLGEAVVAVMQGMESQETWTPPAALCAVGGMGVVFLIWWWYFDRSSITRKLFVHNRHDAVRFHVWSYAHFPLSLGIVLTGVGVHRIVRTVGRAGLHVEEAGLLILAAALVVGGMWLIIAARREADAQAALKGRTPYNVYVRT